MPLRKTIFTETAIAALTALPLSANAQNADMSATQDGKWVSMTGEITAIMNDEFMLDHGDGLVVVEMDDWLGAEDISQLNSGNQVEVTGEVDHDMMEARTIEAARVYSEATDTFYYASPIDEEAGLGLNRTIVPGFTLPESAVTVAGEVTAIDGRMLTLDLGQSEVTVDTTELPYNPVDKVGFPQVQTGDMIQASGNLIASFFQEGVVEAEALTMISKATSAS